MNLISYAFNWDLVGSPILFTIHFVDVICPCRYQFSYSYHNVTRPLTRHSILTLSKHSKIFVIIFGFGDFNAYSEICWDYHAKKIMLFWQLLLTTFNLFFKTLLVWSQNRAHYLRYDILWKIVTWYMLLSRYLWNATLGDVVVRWMC